MNIALPGCALALLFATSPTLAADASNYPAKPMRYIVPFPAGGIADVMSRVLDQKFTWGLSSGRTSVTR